ncbi:MAG: AIR synthase, partial [Chloroflexi bacterium]|nr:AIR synthase [Chloroflexota bacterium]
DLAAMGAEPVGILATLLFPPGCQETDISALVDDLDAAARELGVEILGGHTEVAPELQRPIVSLAGVGLAPRDRLVRSGGARPGHELLLTKAAGLEGTAILAADLAERLSTTLSEDLLARARDFRAELSVVPEGLLAARLGASALHDPTEGGVLGAVWELAEASAQGFELWSDRIPIRPETRAICRALGLDPLKLVSSGAMLIAAERGAALQQGLTAAGIPCAIVGRIVERGRWLIDGVRRTPAAPVVRDELWRALEG